MEVKLAVLADAANISVEGKLNVFGIFTRIGASSFPAVHPQMQLVTILEADAAENGRVREIEVQLMGPDEQRIVTLNRSIRVPRGEPAYPVEMPHILTLNGLPFERPGDHAFHILINGDPKGRVPLQVRESKPTRRLRP